MDNRPIGVFDSGIGGLTAAKALMEQLPNETIIYFGDTGRMPYGGKSRQELGEMAVSNARFLESFGVKAIVVACGSISSNAMDLLAQSTETPVFGVLESSCRKVAETTRTKRVGVIATESSISSGKYDGLIKELDSDIQVICRACPVFAPMVEHGHFRRGDKIAEAAVRDDLAEIKAFGVDTLLLACTHYPLLSDVIADYIGEDVRQISSGAEAVFDLAAYLEKNDMLSEKGGEALWYTSGDVQTFERCSGIFLGKSIKARQHIII